MQVDQKIDGPSWSNWAASAPMPFLRPVDWRRAQGTVEARGDSLRICHDGCAPPIPAIKCTTSLHQIVQWQRKSSARAAWAQNCILQTKVTKVKCLVLCRAHGTHCSYCTNTEVIMQNSACSKVGRSKGSCPRNDDVILGSVKDCPFWRAKLWNFAVVLTFKICSSTNQCASSVMISSLCNGCTYPSRWPLLHLHLRGYSKWLCCGQLQWEWLKLSITKFRKWNPGCQLSLVKMMWRADLGKFKVACHELLCTIWGKLSQRR